MRRIKNRRSSRELCCQCFIGHGPRCQPDNFSQEMIEPNDALLFKSDLCSLLDGFRQIERGLDRKRRRLFEDETRFCNRLATSSRSVSLVMRTFFGRVSVTACS